MSDGIFPSPFGPVSPAVSTLTSQLLAPAATCVDDRARQRVRDQLLSTITSVVDTMAAGDPLVITLPLLRQAFLGSNLTMDLHEPFSWKPAFVRRSLGLAAIDACLKAHRKQRHSTPAQAVATVAGEAVAEWRRTGWRTFHWEPWYAGLSTGARSVVLADATTWASGLWSALDWSQLSSAPIIGGPDDQWICTAAQTVRLKGRSELRIAIDTGPCCHAHSGEQLSHRVGKRIQEGNSPLALVSVASGVPSGEWRSELGFLALVASLRSPSLPVPARIAGLWPESGEYRLIDVSADILTAATDRVLSTVIEWATTRSDELRTAPWPP